MAADGIAVRADYADALIVARRAKGWLVAILLIVLVGEIVLFFCARKVLPDFSVPTVAGLTATTQPASSQAIEKLRYLVGMFDVVGLVCSILLSLVLLLIVNTMLVGRLLGVGRVTSAFIWSIVLIVMIFPWQALLSNPAIVGVPSTGDFKVPGILYTWAELKHPVHGAKFRSDDISFAALKWARYVGFPIVALVILSAVHLRSAKGLRSAMGADEPTIVPPGSMGISMPPPPPPTV